MSKQSVKPSKSQKAIARRKSALERLEKQTTKPSLVEGILQQVPLTEADKKRINKEIEILKTRI